jgi:hypothetical protein
MGFNSGFKGLKLNITFRIARHNTGKPSSLLTSTPHTPN